MDTRAHARAGRGGDQVTVLLVDADPRPPPVLLPVAKPRKPIHICGTCGDSFKAQTGNINKFCSLACTPKRRGKAKWVVK